MRKQREKNLIIENARIGFRNFRGEESRYNPAGKRNFSVFLDPDTAHILEEEGWNVKWLAPRHPDDTEQAFIQVSVNFDNFPPKIVVISSRGKTVLDAESVSILDWAEIEQVDLMIRPYRWILHEGTRNEKRGIKAYLKSMYVTIYEDELERKYSDIPIIDESGDINGD